MVSQREANKQRARSSILAAAKDLFGTQSIEATTTREIANKAGVSYQTLYNYFPTKAQIAEALMQEDIQSWGLAVDGVIKQYQGDLLDSLEQINQIGIREVKGANFEMWAAIVGNMFKQGNGGSRTASLNQIAHERYHALLKLAQGTGQLATIVDVHLLAHTLFCLSDHAFLSYAIQPDQDESNIADTLNQQMQLLLAPYLVS